MSWGILFRRETYLTYKRIQDIHLTRNIIQRWMGLATVSIQTASGSSNAEMSIEGLLQAEPLRDFLYAKMRGAKGEHEPVAADRDSPRFRKRRSAGIAPRHPRLAAESGRPTRCIMSQALVRASEWLYHGIWAVLVRWFRVPAEPPTLPAVAAEPIQSYRPAAGFLRYLKFQFWLLLIVIDGGLLIVWLVLLVLVPLAGVLITPLALAVIIVPAILGYVAIHLRYDTTWYVVSDRSLRIRRGIWVIHETTITFENIQNVTVNQGPLQRWFGIADVLVQTAGGGGGGQPGHEG